MFKVVSPMSIIIDVSPVKYTFNVQATSSDKLPFIVPGLFIIGPRNDDQGLFKYATFVSARHMRRVHVKELVRDVIQREIRVIAALMTMKKINSGANQFRKKVLAKVELELDQFGLQVYNSNVKQLKKVPWYNVRLGWRRVRRPFKLLFSKLCLKGNTDKKANQVSVGWLWSLYTKTAKY